MSRDYCVGASAMALAMALVPLSGAAAQDAGETAESAAQENQSGVGTIIGLVKATAPD